MTTCGFRDTFATKRAVEEKTVYERIIADLLDQQYAVVENFFDPSTVEEIREALLFKYEEDRFKKAAIGNRTNETIARSIRGDFILWLNEKEAGPSEKKFLEKVNDMVQYLNRTCFLGIIQKEFHYAVYPEGTFYKRHLDTFQNDDRRKLSLVLYLNEQEWKPEYGGALVLYPQKNGAEEEVTLFPYPGRMIIFESQILEHEVKPVKKPRLSITGWLKTR